MSKLNENYYLRKCFLDKNEIPTQSEIKMKMGNSLANVYFKDMNYKLKVLTGLEPPMRGGGNDWYVPPADVLQGQVKLKPVKKSFLQKLSAIGIDSLGESFIINLNKRKQEEREKALIDNDDYWKNVIKTNCARQWTEISNHERTKNTKIITEALGQFEIMYTTSIEKMECILFDAAIKAIEQTREKTFNKMKIYYQSLLKKQAILLYDKYTNLLNNEKRILKNRFIRNIEKNRSKTLKTIHDLNIEKHVIIEKLRDFLEYQNIACQVYVTLKEKEECDLEVKKIKKDHDRLVTIIEKEVVFTDNEISLLKQNERKIKELNKIWKIKVCHIFKKFQKFVSYSLKLLPEQADFFINMEKLLLLQMSKIIDNPSRESVIEYENESLNQEPFVIYGDDCLCNKNKNNADMPVFLINKHCIYASCHNLEKISSKLDEFVTSNDNDDFDYSYSLPVKCTSSTQVKELKMQSSLMQLLQNEIVNVNEISTDCCICKVKHCFCRYHDYQETLNNDEINKTCTGNTVTSKTVCTYNKIKSRSIELKHEREPKLKSYTDYVTPIHCSCRGRAKKQLNDHLPPYMLTDSAYVPLDLPNYQSCSVNQLKNIVAKLYQASSTIKLTKEEAKTKDAGTQYYDDDFEKLCNCFSDEEINKLYQDIMKICKIQDIATNKITNTDVKIKDSISSTNINENPEKFVTNRALELRNLINSSPDLQEIFKSSDCNF